MEKSIRAKMYRPGPVGNEAHAPIGAFVGTGEVKNPQYGVTKIWPPDWTPIGACVSCPTRGRQSGHDWGHDEISTTMQYIYEETDSQALQKCIMYYPC